MHDDSFSSSPPASSRGQRRTTIAVTIGVVFVLIFGAWYVGGREGFAQIGRGGQNLKLLPKVGEPAPDIVVPLANGSGIVHLSELRGQPVWLNFWGSWCPPCRAEFPDIQAAYVDDLAPQGVAWLAISLDESAQAATSYAARNGATFTILSDPDRRLTGGAYPIANFPTHILIDRDGIIRAIILAPIDKAEIIQQVRQIIDPTNAG